MTKEKDGLAGIVADGEAACRSANEHRDRVLHMRLKDKKLPPPKKMTPEEDLADYVKQHSVVRGEKLKP